MEIFLFPATIHKGDGRIFFVNGGGLQYFGLCQGTCASYDSDSGCVLGLLYKNLCTFNTLM